MNGSFFAGVSGFVAVALGAFGAHALRGRIEQDLMRVYETAVLYHLVHSAALLAASSLVAHRSRGLPRAALWAFGVGIVLFSGSLYVMTFTGARWLGAVTPVGGVSLLVGWALIALSGWRSQRAKPCDEPRA